MNVVVRGARVIDPLAALDGVRDVWVHDGLIEAVDHDVVAQDALVLDVTPTTGDPLILCPAFIDAHTHLREPGDPGAETMRSGAFAAAAGGFGQVVAMANTQPPVDIPSGITVQRVRARGLPVRILSVAAVTIDLRGERLVDMASCAASGAAAFSDDGRNAASPQLLETALRIAGDHDRSVLVHPENEAMLLAANPGTAASTRCAVRPAECETVAVDEAIAALVAAGAGRLHLQHISTAGAVDALRAARERGLAVTAEVTPHHLAMWEPFATDPEPVGLRRVNPPLRTEADRIALVQALREGVIDAVATDHAPHPDAAKAGPYAQAAPGMIGLQWAFAVCATLGAMGGDWLPVLIDRLTGGPWRALGPSSGLVEPRLRVGARAHLTLIDPSSPVVVGRPSASLSRNTPLWGESVRGRVLLTVVDGRISHLDVDPRVAPLRESVAIGSAS